MFDSFDIDRDGRIDAAELGQALAHYKYANSPTFWFSLAHAPQSAFMSANPSSTC
jgi:Ca2+-binding EF-hand superfamily protein